MGVYQVRPRLSLILSIILWAVLIAALLVVPAESKEADQPDPPAPKELMQEAALSFADVNAEAAQPLTYEDLFRDTATVLPDCTITYYCAEQRPHICGTGSGLTATGTPVTPGWTCAVDPGIIPYGSEVMVDFGDRVEFYKAQDCGGAVRGNHIDLAVDTHANALQKGTQTATVYVMEGPTW